MGRRREAIVRDDGRPRPGIISQTFIGRRLLHRGNRSQSLSKFRPRRAKSISRQSSVEVPKHPNVCRDPRAWCGTHSISSTMGGPVTSYSIQPKSPRSVCHPWQFRSVSASSQISQTRNSFRSRSVAQLTWTIPFALAVTGKGIDEQVPALPVCVSDREFTVSCAMTALALLAPFVGYPDGLLMRPSMAVGLEVALTALLTRRRQRRRSSRAISLKS